MFNEGLKYEGILKDLNLEITNDLLLNELLKRNIYFFEYDTDGYSDSEDTFEFGTRIYFKSKCYILNPEIQEEIYEEMKFFVTDVMSDFNFKCNHLESFLESFLSKEDKLNYLQKRYQKDYAKLFKDSEANLFIKEGDPKQELIRLNTWGVKNWKEMVIDTLDEQIVKQYLKIKFDASKDDIISRWSRFHELKSITDFYLKKINEIENQNSKVRSAQVFKDDGDEMFRHLDFNYRFEKTAAFYSHLYSFLISKDKIIKKTKENKAYREFAESVNKNLKFPNMVITLEGAQNKKSDMFKTFENLLKTYRPS